MPLTRAGLYHQNHLPQATVTNNTLLTLPGDVLTPATPVPAVPPPPTPAYRHCLPCLPTPFLYTYTTWPEPTFTYALHAMTARHYRCISGWRGS